VKIRYLLLTSHYRETFNFTTEGLQGARTSLARLDECVAKFARPGGRTIGDALTIRWSRNSPTAWTAI